MTNEGRIKGMSRDELAHFLCGLMCAECCNARCPASKDCRVGDNGMGRWLNKESEIE